MGEELSPENIQEGIFGKGELGNYFFLCRRIIRVVTRRRDRVVGSGTKVETSGGIEVPSAQCVSTST